MQAVLYFAIMEIICDCLRVTIRFNKIAIQAKGPGGKWTRKPLAYRESISVRLCVTHPPEICVQLVFKHIHTASGYTIRR